MRRSLKLKFATTINLFALEGESILFIITNCIIVSSIYCNSPDHINIGRYWSFVHIFYFPLFWPQASKYVVFSSSIICKAQNSYLLLPFKTIFSQMSQPIFQFISCRILFHLAGKMVLGIHNLILVNCLNQRCPWKMALAHNPAVALVLPLPSAAAHLPLHPLHPNVHHPLHRIHLLVHHTIYGLHFGPHNPFFGATLISAS